MIAPDKNNRFSSRFFFFSLALAIFFVATTARPVHAADSTDPNAFPGGGDDTPPEFSTGAENTTPEEVNPLARPNQFLFDADIGFIPTIGPNVTGAIGNAQPGTGFLVGLEAGYTLVPNLVLTVGMSVHAFGNLTNMPLLFGLQYYFDNGGGIPATMGGNTMTLIPYLEMGFGPAFNISSDSNNVGVGALAFAFRIGPGVLLPFGKNKKQGLFFEVDYETQSGPFNGNGVTSSGYSLIPVKIGYTTIF
ncbi:hypothetical protein [Leptospirillum ferriphilum]|uniref:Outer membrane protein beta-barrel domain-containing protein n=1 Tax=Leptospirillum ferriphilum YSK TaxID=1441628 RepID=A0A059Y0T7_9BACT|nr:hypothetical protein [Leptospirillum ferriphilum]AIA31082.1 hypothetical protein Y981_11035 [Leptospirillum ferriphilum YSK]